jgi:hypothetical protein
MYTRFVAPTYSNQANYSHNRQSCVHSAMAKNTTLNTMEPSSISSTHYDCPTVPSNFPSARSPCEAEPKRHQKAEETHSTSPWQPHNEETSD